MIKAIQLLRRIDPIFRERICFTLGLFCGHMKSARFVESFAWQMNVPFNKIQEVEFRYKHPERPANWYNAKLTMNNGQSINKDWWHLKDGDWGAGYFMNSACNYCDDVVAETADISFGDAWVEPYSSDGMGTNVIIVRSKTLKNLIDQGIAENKLNLKKVDAAFVEQTQAAGLRQRREGLAYRLTWYKTGIKPIKRVQPGKPAKNRRIIYRLRFRISQWSHRLFWLATKLKMPFIYLSWARISASIYYGIAYHRGSLSKIKTRYRDLKKDQKKRLKKTSQTLK
jgi:coenzyme F420-reducing hydrogenase beta subunit